MNILSVIQKYSTPAFDQVYIAESKTAILDTGYKFLNLNIDRAGEVEVMDFLFDGLSDYYKVNEGITGTDYVHKQSSTGGDGYEKANVTARWKPYFLTQDRGTQFQIDASSNEENDGMLIANTSVEFYRTKYIPEKDAYTFSKLASLCKASYGNYIEETIAANTIFSKFDDAFEWMAEHEVPEQDQVIFVTPATMKLMKKSNEVTKILVQQDFRNANGITFKLPAYEGRPIIEVPSSRFFTNVVTGSKGYYPAKDSKVINFMIVSKRAVCPIQKINKMKIFTPEVVQDFDGYKVNMRVYYDIIVPENKIPGIYVSVSQTTATTKVNLVDVDVVAGTVTNAFQVKSYLSTPAGINGRLIYNTTSTYTIGAEKPVSGTDKLVTLNTDIVEASASSAYFAIIDSNNKVKAISKQVTLTKKSD